MFLQTYGRAEYALPSHHQPGAERTKTNEELSHTGAVWSLGINQRWNETQLKFW